MDAVAPSSVNAFADILKEPHPYDGKCEVAFEAEEGNPLKVHIYTENLYGEFTSMKHLPAYASLFGSEKVMVSYADGSVRDAEYSKRRVTGWDGKPAAQNPWTAIAFQLQDLDVFVAHVVVGGGYYEGRPETEGQAEMAGFGPLELQHKGYGIEVATAVVHGFVPKIVDYPNDGFKFREIVCTARPDNPGSVRIAANLGMTCTQKSFYGKYQADRLHFSLLKDELGTEGLGDRVVKVWDFHKHAVKHGFLR